MLVYANNFVLAPPHGLESIIYEIARWVGTREDRIINPTRLLEGIHDLRFPNSGSLNSLATIDEAGQKILPFYFNSRYMHKDEHVAGRRWVTEIGLKQETDENEIHFSILTQTEEISALVTQKIQVTRPRIVLQILDHCGASPQTVGLKIIQLTENNARGFPYFVEREDRKHPLVQVSCKPDGTFPVDFNKLKSLLVGIAQVIKIPATADTFQIQEIVGRKYSTFGGAINIISPYRKFEGGGGACKNIVFKPEQIAELAEKGLSIEGEIFATISHQTNLPHSWRHISKEKVKEIVLRSRLTAAVNRASLSEETAAYDELLNEVYAQFISKNEALDEARLQLKDRTEELDRLSVKIDQISAEKEGLKHTLERLQTRPKIDDSYEISEKMTDALKAALIGKPTLEQCLIVMQALYQDRLIVLDSAYSSARESDNNGFQNVAKAFDLLKRLANGYWSDLNNGKGDQRAKDNFGKNDFAAKEADSLSAEGRKRRTFHFKGRDIVMEKHLKLGVKDSFAETLRIHFYWIPEEQVIVIGHCGKHLPL